MDEYFNNLLAYLESLKDLMKENDRDMYMAAREKILCVCEAIECRLNINTDKNEDDCNGDYDDGDGHNDGDSPIEQLFKAMDERVKKAIDERIEKHNLTRRM